VHCNGRLFSRGCLAAQERAGSEQKLFSKESWAAAAWMSVCIGMRARPSRFSVASRETPRILLVSLAFFPVGNGLSAFPVSFSAFFSGYQRACLFFSVLLSSAKMSFPSSLSGLLLCFEAMLDFLRYASMPHFAVL
jgi:hypothetical protein